MLARTLFSSDYQDFRTTVSRFIEREVKPHHDQWEKDGIVPRDLWLKAGEAGLLCTAVSDELGGAGGDRLHSTIVLEEIAYHGVSGLGFNVHSDIVAIYIANHGTDEQKKTWLPKMASGEAIGAIAMTEPGTGSDLQSITTRAVEDGEDYILNGAKTFISNGRNCDFAVVAATTGEPGSGAAGVTLFIVEADREGFEKGRNLAKLGMKAQDTAELSFTNVRVPASNVLAGVGMGFGVLMAELAWERLMIAIGCVAGARAAYDNTVAYVKERKAFKRPVAKFQNTRFKLADMKTEIQLGQSFVDQCMELEMKSALSIDAAASAKYWTSEMLCRVVDECVQLHGGYGYMLEYPITKAYADARVQRIYGGTTEIMKEIVARSIV
ncbi:MAG: acyl-CoA dehydrogenase family protein [Pseudomonadota bacterium]